MRLQERDYQLMRLCYEQRFLTREHVASFFGHFTAFYRRVWGLEKAALIKRNKEGAGRSAFVIRLTPLGESLVQQKYGFIFPPLKSLNLNMIFHDALVTSVRLRLAEVWKNTRYIPERALQAKEFSEIPDGIFFFPSGNGIAVEVECSDKGKTRFLEKVESWERSPSIVFVLYITPHIGLFETLSRYLKCLPEDRPVGVVQWEELKSGTPLVQTKKGLVDLFLIETVRALRQPRE